MMVLELMEAKAREAEEREWREKLLVENDQEHSFEKFAEDWRETEVCRHVIDHCCDIYCTVE